MCPEILATQADTMSGESPSRRHGATSISVQAVTSLGRLISERRLPASESSDRALGLDASSSMSPRRGSMSGSMDLNLPQQRLDIASVAADTNWAPGIEL